MGSSILEIRLTDSLDIVENANVVFTIIDRISPGIEYDISSGEIKFKELGQYLINWWVSTETTLKGVMVFELHSMGNNLALGCSPIKTGQVTGFGVIDVNAINTVLTLKNRSFTDTVLSKKTRTKAYLLITPIGSAQPRVYRGNLSSSGSYMQVPLGNGLYYRLEYLSATQVRLFFEPMNGSTVYDYRRFTVFDGVSTQGTSLDNTTINARVQIDADIYNNSREMHFVLVRVQNPETGLWSLYEVRLFASGAGTRVTVWVNVIEEEVSY